MGNYVKAIVLVIILLFFITFGVKNSEPTRLSYYFILNAELPLYGIVYISIVIGILIGLAVGLRNRFILKKQLKDLDKEYRELREGIDIPPERLEKTVDA